jgi:branched-subunit amino acid aminotransferase/4-amino-4-deoxychorismate lyase
LRASSIAISASDFASPAQAIISNATSYFSSSTICPIGEITAAVPQAATSSNVDRGTGKVYDYGNEAGPVCTKLYETLTGIQQGSVEDKHNWNLVVE